MDHEHTRNSLESREKTEGLSLLAEQGGVLPLSYAQQRLWFLSQLDPDSPAYNIPMAFRLRGPLDVPALEQSFTEMIRRHEALRSTFTAPAGQPVLVIQPPGPFTLPLTDLRSLPRDGRETTALQLATEEAHRPFDLTADPLLRALLIRLDDDDHLLLLTLHHIVTDGWSNSILLRELSDLYHAFVAGQPSPLLHLPFQYPDFAAWQQQWLQSDDFARQLAYWKQQLGGSLPILQLPTDHPRPPIQTFRGARASLTLPRALADQLRAFGLREGTTLFMTLLAAFKALLFRYTGQDDLLVGTPVASRNRPEFEQLAGFFANTLVLRSHPDTATPFSHFLRQVREVALDAYSHQDIPFEKLVEALQPERSLSHTPLFQLMFVLQNAPDVPLTLPALSVTPVTVSRQTAKFDLLLEILEHDGLTATVEYNADLFDPPTIQRLLSHYQTLLEGVVANPEQPLSTLPLLTGPERRQLLHDWNDTQVRYPDDRLIHQVVADQARLTPDAIAVVFEGTSLTYRELDQRANQLANHLCKYGVGPEVLVGICMDRSLEMIVGLLAILKSGAAYVPLDPFYPADRLAFMVADSAVPVLLTQSHLVSRLPRHTAPVVLLDTGWDAFNTYPTSPPVCKATLSSTAYMIYTSGSTGRPKGVLVPHAGILNRLLWMQEAYRLSATDRILQKTPFSFDVSVWEFFWPLMTGARLVVAIPGGHQDPAYLVDLIVREEITTLHFVPSMLQLFLQQHDLHRCRSLRRVICSGEALPYELQAQFFASIDAAELHNLYGPTEASVDVTFWHCRPDSSLHTVPIGRPIANTQMYILDAQLQPVPIGVAGELHIGGIGLASGYLNRPELTSEKFIPDPFRPEPGARLYKTGDLARFLQDGAIEYLGRMDHQVKIRGQRIELGEIEAVLARHPAVRDALLIAREESPGDKRLVAYVVPGTGGAPPVDHLRAFLKEALPEYMIPSAFVLLDALPLTPNGKVDRKALPAPELVRPDLAVAFVAPRTPQEDVLAAIWAQVLDQNRIGIHDNFFDLGGHSLLATQVISRIREALHVDLPLRRIFESPTIAGLIPHIEAARQGHSGRATSVLRPVPRSGPLPLASPQQRLWFLSQLDPASAAYNVPMAFRLRGPLDVPVLERSLTELIRRHEVLRSTVSAPSGQPVLVIHPPGSFTLPLTDLRSLPRDDRETTALQAAAEEAHRPFDLAAGPLLRAALLQLDDDDHLLLLTLHHIVTDGWSNGILLRELSDLYQAFASGQPSPLPDLPVQYPDYAAWQQEWLQGDDSAQQLAYWKRQLGGSLPILQLPSDRPRPPVQTFRGGDAKALLSPELTKQIKALGLRKGATLFMVLLAAWKLLLCRLTGQEDIIIGTPIASRRWAKLESLVGCFLNTLPLRTDLSGNPTFQDLLGRVREVVLEAFAHQDVPFERLVEEIQPERSLNRTPIFDVLFNLVTAPASPTLPGVSAQHFTWEEPEPKFAMTVYLYEVGNQVSVEIVYQRDLFDEQRVVVMLDQLVHLLQQAVDNPNREVRSYNLITPTTARLLPDPTAVLPEPSYPLITEMFEARVRERPENPALSLNGDIWTYATLSRRTRAIAAEMPGYGHEAGQVVAVQGNRSFELIAAMLAVFMSGGVLLAIDPALPKERHRVMLQEAKVSLLMECGTDVRWLRIDPTTGDPLGVAQSAGHKGTPVSPKPNDPAYIFFTSGSTGLPKAVRGSHKGLAHFLHWQRLEFGIGEHDRFAQLTGLSFDVVLRDVFLPLVSGATLCLPPGDTGLDPARLIPWLGQEQITCLHAVPSLARHWISERSGTVVDSLRLAFFAGEPLTEELVCRWQAVFQRASVINLYGPTETTLAKFYYRVPSPPVAGVQPVGLPLPETQGLVLTAEGQLCGIGELGEVWIRTPFRSLGYFNAPEENQNRFIVNPFREHNPEDELYRTGDLGRTRPDGTLALVGRADHQVKIRGMRVEPSEVATILSRHEDVDRCEVVSRKDKSGEHYLAAYVVHAQGTTVSAQTLRRYLLQYLPAGLVPSVFVFVQSLPLTPNGKIDRQRLPEPTAVTSETLETYVAPRTAVEQIIERILAEVLEMGHVSIDADFFALGGHSLLAVRVVSRLQETLDVALPLRAMFEAPSVIGLSEEILRDPSRRSRIETIAELTVKLSSLSEEEVEKWLGERVDPKEEQRR